MIRKMLKPILCVALLLSVIACSEDGDQQKPEKNIKLSPQAPDLLKPSVVYGEDDRLDLYQVEDANLIALARSTVGLVRSNKLIEQADGSINMILSSYKNDYQLCTDEPFYEQKTGAFCSGFLVAPNVIITAGHCIRSQADCEKTFFVFDFAIFDSVQVTPSNFKKDQVYKCMNVLSSVVVGTGADFAVVEIDRNVEGRELLSLRSEGIVEVGAPLTVIGHPAGLPTKVAGGATVRSVNNNFFVANLDTYGGNSGSAVFNSSTGEVEGILVRGETDYKYRNGCYVSYTCENDTCRGEDVTRIDKAVVDLLLTRFASR